MLALVRRFALNDNGATAIEYGLIAAAMGLGLIIALTTFGSSLSGMFAWVTTKAGGAMDAAEGG
jgi:pilus assembly protein Flp/PilA